MAGQHRRPPVAARHRKPPRAGHVVAPAVIAVAVLGLGGVGAQAALTGTSHGHLPRLVPGLVVPLPQPLTSGTHVVAPPRPVAPAHRPAAAISGFAITVPGSVSWVQVSSRDGHVLFAGMLRHGRSLHYNRGPLVITLGNAGAVRLVLHGRLQHAAAGKAGQVLRFTYR